MSFLNQKRENWIHLQKHPDQKSHEKQQVKGKNLSVPQGINTKVYGAGDLIQKGQDTTQLLAALVGT